MWNNFEKWVIYCLGVCLVVFCVGVVVSFWQQVVLQ